MNNLDTSKTCIIAAFTILASACAEKNDYDAQGTFEATEITVSSETTGKIMTINVEEGDSIADGSIIGVVDTLQLSLQRKEIQQQIASLQSSRPEINSQVASLREQIAGTTIDRDRTQRLLAAGAATQQQLDNYNTKLASLEGQLRAQLSSLNNNISTIDNQISALETQADAIGDKIKRSVITAPMNGTVLTKIAEPGEVATYGTPLIRMADTEKMYLRAYFTSEQLSDISVGQKVTVVSDYGGGNEKSYDGVISFIATQSEFTPKTIQTKDSRANLVYAVKIAVKNDGLLKIGLSGNVYLNNKN